MNTVYIESLSVAKLSSLVKLAKRMKPTMMNKMKYAKIIAKTGADAITTWMN